MGILEEINDKLDRLLAAQGGAAPAAAAAGAKTETATQKKAREKAEAAEAAAASKPEFNAEQLRDLYVEVQNKHGAPVAKALIAEMGHEKLANLIADVPNWQQYWDAAEVKLAEEVEGDDNGGL